jgi:hypothetical protein
MYHFIEFSLSQVMQALSIVLFSQSFPIISKVTNKKFSLTGANNRADGDYLPTGSYFRSKKNFTKKTATCKVAALTKGSTLRQPDHHSSEKPALDSRLCAASFR